MEVLKAVLLFCFTGTVYLVTENLFKAGMVGKSVRVNPLLLLLSIIGGIAQFGILGLFYGPLALSLFLSMLEIFTRNVELRSQAEGEHQS